MARPVLRHEIDTMVILVWTVSALAFGVGMWDIMRARKQEDLTHEIFPE